MLSRKSIKKVTETKACYYLGYIIAEVSPGTIVIQKPFNGNFLENCGDRTRGRREVASL